jgi:hypothetical protein
MFPSTLEQANLLFGDSIILFIRFDYFVFNSLKLELRHN